LKYSFRRHGDVATPRSVRDVRQSVVLEVQQPLLEFKEHGPNGKADPAAGSTLVTPDANLWQTSSDGPDLDEECDSGASESSGGPNTDLMHAPLYSNDDPWQDDDWADLLTAPPLAPPPANLGQQTDSPAYDFDDAGYDFDAGFPTSSFPNSIPNNAQSATFDDDAWPHLHIPNPFAVEFPVIHPNTAPPPAPRADTPAMTLEAINRSASLEEEVDALCAKVGGFTALQASATTEQHVKDAARALKTTRTFLSQLSTHEVITLHPKHLTSP
jgi:hypothetical protein